MNKVQVFAKHNSNIEYAIIAKPILKWAGGKSQLLRELLPKIPRNYGRYIEPFLGGGALYFSIHPSEAVVADRNPKIVNLYKTLAANVESVISCLKNIASKKVCLIYSTSFFAFY